MYTHCISLECTELHFLKFLGKIVDMNTLQEAKRRDAAGLCVVCEKAEDNRRRGLCVTDYNRFRQALLQVPQDRRQEFEALMIAQGRLLESRQGRRAVTDDVFADALADFLGLPDDLAAEYHAARERRSDDDAQALAQQAVTLAETAQKATKKAGRSPRKTAPRKKQAPSKKRGRT